jgi:hypothetical protein
MLFLQVHLASVMRAVQLVHTIYNSFSGTGSLIYLCSQSLISQILILLFIVINWIYRGAAAEEKLNGRGGRIKMCVIQLHTWLRLEKGVGRERKCIDWNCDGSYNLWVRRPQGVREKECEIKMREGFIFNSQWVFIQNIFSNATQCFSSSFFPVLFLQREYIRNFFRNTWITFLFDNKRECKIITILFLYNMYYLSLMVKRFFCILLSSGV